MIEQIGVQMDTRIIGSYEGVLPGPLFICLGGMHGNEHAGIQALNLIFKMLEVEPITNHGFQFRGKIVGLIGNVQAYKKNKRFIKRDLNRQLTRPNVDRVFSMDKSDLEAEDLELRLLIETIRAQISQYNPERVVLLDLHTTTAWGGIFSLVTDDEESLRIAKQLNVPVVKDMLNGIHGTTMHYFNRDNFGLDIVPVTFESGQHKEQLSVNRAIAAIINCMRTLGCVRPSDVENIHDHLLIDYAKDLPKVTKMVYTHKIKPDDDFGMFPGYKNFEFVEKGQILAHDVHGLIRSPYDGLILMPLYQKQGEDGFFIVQEINPSDESS